MKKMTSRGEEMYSSDVFQILFEYEISRSRRYPAPLALLQIEMTPTAMGTESLQAASAVFASALNAHLRSVDIPSKAGNIFMALLPYSDEHGARAVCERLLSIFKNKFESQSNVPVAFSLQIGATAHVGGASISNEELLQKAEEALKQSKLKGPNTFVVLT